jgi:hypothetical protein
MKTWMMPLAVVVAGIGVGYGSAVREFQDLTEQFEPHRMSTTTSQRQKETSGFPKATVVGGESYDFGSGQRESQMEHTFTIRNDGDAPLNMIMGETTCKCTLGDLENAEVKPGESFPVKLSWKLVTIGAHFRQSASIHTDDPERPTVVLSIYGNVSDLVRLDPTNLALSSVSAGEETTAHFHLYSFGDEPLELLEYEFSNSDTEDYFELTFENVDPTTLDDVDEQPTHAIRGDLRVKSGLPLGPINQTIRMTTNIDTDSNLELLVLGSVVSDISVVGPSYGPKSGVLKLGTVARGEGAEASLKILVKGPYRDQVHPEVAEVEPSDVLAASIGDPKSINNGALDLYELTVSVSQDARPISRLSTDRDELGRIVIKTTHPIAKEFIIYVRFAVE